MLHPGASHRKANPTAPRGVRVSRGAPAERPDATAMAHASRMHAWQMHTAALRGVTCGRKPRRTHSEDPEPAEAGACDVRREAQGVA